jgi:hypothetical protein
MIGAGGIMPLLEDFADFLPDSLGGFDCRIGGSIASSS